jgi:phytoene dehydrogenase-like protein
MAGFDAVIIGAGHNGLTLGAYMSRAGLTVCVLERSPRIGGGCSTEEPALPGFRFNLHSNFYIAWADAPLTRDLELFRYGFSTIEPPVQQGVALRDGTALVIHQDVEKSCASIARFSVRDAETYRELHEAYGVSMRPLFASLTYNPPLAPDVLRDRLSGPQAREYLAFAQSDLFTAVDRRFEDFRIRMLFKLLLYAGAGENAAGSGLALPAMIAALTRNALPVGGSASLPLALARVIAAGGGKVETNAEYARSVLPVAGRPEYASPMARQSRRRDSSPARSMRRARWRSRARSTSPKTCGKSSTHGSGAPTASSPCISPSIRRRITPLPHSTRT